MPRDDDNDLREGLTTVPPPAGEEDPYGAPTKVVRVPETVLDELMKARAEATRAETTGAQISLADAATNDLSALAAAASHVVVPPRPKAPPLPASGKPLAARAAPAPAHVAARGRPASPPAAPAAPAAPAVAAEPAASSPVDAIPCLHDEGPADVTVELPSKAGTAAPPSPMQSGRTVPLSAGLLADVLKGVEERRAAAAAAAGPAAPAPSGPPAQLEAPGRTRRSVLALALVLAVGLSVFITGVVMFLDALR
jgi:hypothetical protein